MVFFSEQQINEVFTTFQTACMAIACCTSLISFAALADTKDFEDATAFQFTVAAGILVWVYLLFVLFLPSLNMAGFTFPFNDLDGTVRSGNWGAFLLAYTAAVACLSISSDIDEAIFDDDEQSGRRCRHGFCAKVYTCVVFIWFTTGFMALAVADKETTILEEIGITSPKPVDAAPYYSENSGTTQSQYGYDAGVAGTEEAPSSGIL